MPTSRKANIHALQQSNRHAGPHGWRAGAQHSKRRAAGHHQDAGAGLAGSIATRQNVGLSPHYFAQPTLSANRPFPDRRHTAQTSRRPEINSRSEEHTSELQSLMRISYAVFCLKKKKTNKP